MMTSLLIAVLGTVGMVWAIRFASREIGQTVKVIRSLRAIRQMRKNLGE